MAPIPAGLRIVPRMDQKDMIAQRMDANVLLDIWIYFNLIPNTILLPILVATFLFSKRVKRHPTLINLCMTWIFSGVFSLLLFYAGKYKPETPEPPKPLCIAQTSLLYGITPMWSVAICVMLCHLIMVLNGREVGRGNMLLMLAAPYVVQLLFSISCLVLAVQHPDKVNRHRRFFYCALENEPLSDTMAVFTAVVCVGITVLETHLAVILYRHWRGLKKAGKAVFDLQLVIRVFLFGMYIFFGMVVDVISIFDTHTLVPDIYAATIGTVLVLVFATQTDVWRVWCFWRREKPAQVFHVSISEESSDKIDLVKSPESARAPCIFPPSKLDNSHKNSV